MRDTPYLPLSDTEFIRRQIQNSSDRKIRILEKRNLKFKRKQIFVILLLLEKFNPRRTILLPPSDIGRSSFEVLNSSRKLIPEGELFAFVDRHRFVVVVVVVVVVVGALSSCALADFS